MTNLGSILKRRDITLPTKVHPAQALVVPLVMYGCESWTKTLMQEKKGTTEDEMVGWHHQHNGHGFGWTLGVGDGQGGLACCSPWGCKESDMTERLN